MYTGVVAGIHCQGQDLAFFFSLLFFSPQHLFIFCNENAMHIGGFYFVQLQFMWLATYERRVPDLLCSPLINLLSNAG